MESNRSLVIAELLGERIGQASEMTYLHSHREVLTLDVRR
jgi:hypothetical protein